MTGWCFYVNESRLSFTLISTNRWLSTSFLLTFPPIDGSQLRLCSHFRQQMALTRRYSIRVFLALLLEGAAPASRTFRSKENNKSFRARKMHLPNHFSQGFLYLNNYGRNIYLFLLLLFKCLCLCVSIFISGCIFIHPNTRILEQTSRNK